MDCIGEQPHRQSVSRAIVSNRGSNGSGPSHSRKWPSEKDCVSAAEIHCSVNTIPLSMWLDNEVVIGINRPICGILARKPSSAPSEARGYRPWSDHVIER